MDDTGAIATGVMGMLHVANVSRNARLLKRNTGSCYPCTYIMSHPFEPCTPTALSFRPRHKAYSRFNNANVTIPGMHLVDSESTCRGIDKVRPL